MEILQSIIEAAEAEKSPVIIQASQGGLKYAGLNMLQEWLELLQKRRRCQLH